MKGILLVNLGSPDSPHPEDVRRYLREFLSDPRVLDSPAPIRATVLNLFILPFRPKESGEAYEQIWTEDGSPLIVLTQRVARLLREKTDLPIEVGMRYGEPSIRKSLITLLSQGVREVFCIPLYPHYAMSSYETVVAKVQTELASLDDKADLVYQPPFYNDEDYIDALVESARPYLEAKDFDLLLMSYHGIPERHIRKTDPSGCYCLKVRHCCERPHPAHAFCYRHQVLTTSKQFAKKAGLSDDKWALTFQSRLGRDPWLQPYTDVELEALPSKGIKRLLVMCPAFVSDCLETIEEIGMRGHESFMDAGGKSYQLIPCLNDHPAWIDVLHRMVRDFETMPKAGMTDRLNRIQTPDTRPL